MTESCLSTMISRFLATARAKRLCQHYDADPLEAWGELYLRLRGRATAETICNVDAWVNVNGLGVLRNYLRKERVIRP